MCLIKKEKKVTAVK